MARITSHFKLHRVSMSSRIKEAAVAFDPYVEVPLRPWSKKMLEQMPAAMRRRTLGHPLCRCEQLHGQRLCFRHPLDEDHRTICKCRPQPGRPVLRCENAQ